MRVYKTRNYVHKQIKNTQFFKLSIPKSVLNLIFDSIIRPINSLFPKNYFARSNYTVKGLARGI